jgi:hypothetical protein
MNRATSHKCPLEGCSKQVPHHILMCYPHWKQVPPEIQKRVNRTWREGPVEAYLQAREAAIRSVQSEEVPDAR